MATAAVSKAALVHLTRVLDLELRPPGIRVNAVAPAGSRVRTIKTFGVPGPVTRITVIWWRFLSCLAATLVVVRPR